MRGNLARTAGLIAIALVVNGCPSTGPGAGGSAAQFRVTHTWNIPKGDFEYYFTDLSTKGSATLDGSLPLAFLRDSPPAESAQASAKWSTQSTDALDYYEQGSCPGDDLTKCNICRANYEVPAHDLDVDYRVDSRNGSDVVVYTWVYNLPNPQDEQYNTSGCHSVGGVNQPYRGWYPLLITFTVGPSNATPTAVKFIGELGEEYPELPYETLNVASLQ